MNILHEMPFSTLVLSEPDEGILLITLSRMQASNAIDTVMTRELLEIWQCLTQLKQAGQSILVIDKNVAALIAIADRHYMIERGRTVWSGTSRELAAVPDVQHRYLGV